MHLKTKKKKKKSPRPAPTAGSCAPRRRPTLSTAPAAAVGGPRAPPAAASGQLPVRPAVPALHGGGRCPLQPQIN